MQFYGQSDIGKVRKDNEDSYLFQQINEQCGIVVVADGMGGHRGGKKASSAATEDIIHAIEKDKEHLDAYSDQDFKRLLTRVIQIANRDIYKQSSQNSEFSGMGTTVVVCIIAGDHFYAANVGDSRLYTYTDHLTQITVDHSYVRELVEMGMISEQQALVHPSKNIITRAVGTEKNVLVDVYCGKLSQSDILLICTDGLTNMVSVSEIEKTIEREKDLSAITNSLIHTAVLNGGKDNVTVVTAQIDDGGEQTI